MAQCLRLRGVRRNPAMEGFGLCASALGFRDLGLKATMILISNIRLLLIIVTIFVTTVLFSTPLP